MPRLRNPTQRGDLYVTINAKLPPDLEKIRAELNANRKPNASEWTADEIIGVLIILAVGLVAGIGAGLLLYWLIFD
jgi:hypothetical protein